MLRYILRPRAGRHCSPALPHRLLLGFVNDGREAGARTEIRLLEELFAVSLLLLPTTRTSLCATVGDDMFEWGQPEDAAYASSTKAYGTEENRTMLWAIAKILPRILLSMWKTSTTMQRKQLASSLE